VRRADANRKLVFIMQSFTPEVQRRFKYWQMRTLIATMIGYALFYFVRKNFSLAMPGLEADLGISKTSLDRKSVV